MRKNIRNDLREGQEEDTYQTEETQQSEKVLENRKHQKMIPKQVQREKEV